MPGREYAIARVRGLAGRLLGVRGVLELLAQPSDAARLELLRRSDHGEALPPGDVDAALAAWALRARPPLAARRVLALLDDDRRGRTLLAALLGFADVRVVKTILRGVARGTPAARLLEILLPTPELDEAALRELTAQRDVKAVIDTLATWGSPLAPPLAQALPEQRRGHDLLPLELALDRMAFARARAAAALSGGPDGRMARELVGDAVDLANAATLLALAGRGAAPGLWLPGGRALSAERWAELATRPAAEVHAALATDRALRLADAFLDGRADPVLLERTTARRREQVLRRAARLEPLSLAVPLLYLADLEEEVRDIRLVLLGSSLGMPAEEVSTLIALVGRAA
jgi:V/A-type H+/Na+-transporting ATPase subunit C